MKHIAFNGKNLAVGTGPGRQLIRWSRPTAIKTGYGALYNYPTTQQELITGFRCPSDSEYTELITLLGGEIVAGGKLKSTRTDPTIAPRWDDPNTGATDEVNFAALPGGHRRIDGIFGSIARSSFWWSATDGGAEASWARTIQFNSSNANRIHANNENGYSIRCLRDLIGNETSLPDGTFLQSAQDYNGNWYEVVKIGDYAWTAQNLRATNFADGTPILNVTDDVEWADLTTPGYCWYNNDINTSGILFTDEVIPL